ncbi:unnamed protein product [Linum tenue]|uniref:Uncharacterized protein n=1 Tax=Linum tenue TaxID=586396 RepID=A0AAV0N1R6_9ROSI|nr:unnamed protein product [Linum tenue]
MNTVKASFRTKRKTRVETTMAAPGAFWGDLWRTLQMSWQKKYNLHVRDLSLLTRVTLLMWVRVDIDAIEISISASDTLACSFSLFRVLKTYDIRAIVSPVKVAWAKVKV